MMTNTERWAQAKERVIRTEEALRKARQGSNLLKIDICKCLHSTAQDIEMEWYLASIAD